MYSALYVADQYRSWLNSDVINYTNINLLHETHSVTLRVCLTAQKQTAYTGQPITPLGFISVVVLSAFQNRLTRNVLIYQ